MKRWPPLALPPHAVAINYFPDAFPVLFRAAAGVAVLTSSCRRRQGRRGGSTSEHQGAGALAARSPLLHRQADHQQRAAPRTETLLDGDTRSWP